MLFPVHRPGRISCSLVNVKPFLLFVALNSSEYFFSSAEKRFPVVIPFKEAFLFTYSALHHFAMPISWAVCIYLTFALCNICFLICLAGWFLGLLLWACQGDSTSTAWWGGTWGTSSQEEGRVLPPAPSMGSRQKTAFGHSLAPLDWFSPISSTFWQKAQSGLQRAVIFIRGHGHSTALRCHRDVSPPTTSPGTASWTPKRVKSSAFTLHNHSC